MVWLYWSVGVGVWAGTATRIQAKKKPGARPGFGWRAGERESTRR